MREYPTPPPWVADLPRMSFHDLPALAGIPWEAGQPTAGAGCKKRTQVLGCRRACLLCGYRLGPRVCVVFTDPGTHYQFPGPVYAGTAAMHRSCALYSAAVCPFLRYETSKKRRTTHALRGGACVAEFDSYGMFYPPSPWLGGQLDGVVSAVWFGYFDLADELPIGECAANYASAVAADAALEFTTTPRLYWTDTPDDAQSLDAMWQRASRYASTALLATPFGPAPSVTVGGHPYRMKLLPMTPPDPRGDAVAAATSRVAARRAPGGSSLPPGRAAIRRWSPGHTQTHPHMAECPPPSGGPSTIPGRGTQPLHHPGAPSRTIPGHPTGNTTPTPPTRTPALSTTPSTSRVASGAQPAGGDAGGGGTARS